MSDTPEELGRFTVTISADGADVETVRFDTIEEAEQFLEQCTDEPGVTGVIDDGSVDHTAGELVEADTALPEDHERPD